MADKRLKPYQIRLNDDGTLSDATSTELHSSRALKEYIDSSTSSGDLNISSNILVVHNQGDNATAIKGNLAKAWSDIDQALFDATSGDIIWVLKGSYDLGSTELVLKEGVPVYFEEGAHVTYEDRLLSAGNLVTGTYELYGKGTFEATGNGSNKPGFIKVDGATLLLSAYKVFSSDGHDQTNIAIEANNDSVIRADIEWLDWSDNVDSGMIISTDTNSNNIYLNSKRINGYSFNIKNSSGGWIHSVSEITLVSPNSATYGGLDVRKLLLPALGEAPTGKWLIQPNIINETVAVPANYTFIHRNTQIGDDGNVVLGTDSEFYIL